MPPPWRGLFFWKKISFYEVRTDHAAERHGSRRGAGCWFEGGKKKGKIVLEKMAHILILRPYFCRGGCLHRWKRKKHEKNVFLGREGFGLRGLLSLKAKQWMKCFFFLNTFIQQPAPRTAGVRASLWKCF